MVTRFSSRAASASIMGWTPLSLIERMKGARSETCIADSSAMFFFLMVDFSAAWLRRAPLQAGQFASPDALLTVSSIARAAHDPAVAIEPASKVGLVYGLPCAVYHQFPAAYYLAARFQGDMEQGVLNAVNAGGQNQARAMLAGALCGALGGLEAIPARFIAGLEKGEEYLALAKAVAERVG